MAGALPPERLSGVPGVVAVALWGPQGGASGGADGERVLGLYYRGQLTVDEIRALDGAAEVWEPGAWGRIANGGARLQVEGRRALVRYRDLEAVEHWSKEAEEGRYEVEAAPDYVAGMPSYALAAELALAEVLAGELPHPGFPEALRASAPGGWAAAAALALEAAGRVASRGDAVECAGLLAKAATAAAQGRLAERGEWAVDEVGVVRRAGFGRAGSILAALGDRPLELERAVAAMRTALGEAARAPAPSS